MAYCAYCGASVDKETEICMKCGCRTYKKPTTSDKCQVLRIISLVFMIMGCGAWVFCALMVAGGMFVVGNMTTIVALIFDPTYSDMSIFFIGLAIALCCLLPLIWSIPMTVHYFKSMKNKKTVGIAFKICVLIFVNLIAGILMLCDKNNSKNIIQ